MLTALTTDTLHKVSHPSKKQTHTGGIDISKSIFSWLLPTVRYSDVTQDHRKRLAISTAGDHRSCWLHMQLVLCKHALFLLAYHSQYHQEKRVEWHFQSMEDTCIEIKHSVCSFKSIVLAAQHIQRKYIPARTLVCMFHNMQSSSNDTKRHHDQYHRHCPMREDAFRMMQCSITES